MKIESYVSSIVIANFQYQLIVKISIDSNFDNISFIKSLRLIVIHEFEISYTLIVQFDIC